MLKRTERIVTGCKLSRGCILVYQLLSRTAEMPSRFAGVNCELS